MGGVSDIVVGSISSMGRIEQWMQSAYNVVLSYPSSAIAATCVECTVERRITFSSRGHKRDCYAVR